MERSKTTYQSLKNVLSDAHNSLSLLRKVTKKITDKETEETNVKSAKAKKDVQRK